MRILILGLLFGVMSFGVNAQSYDDVVTLTGPWEKECHVSRLTDAKGCGYTIYNDDFSFAFYYSEIEDNNSVIIFYRQPSTLYSVHYRIDDGQSGKMTCQDKLPLGCSLLDGNEATKFLSDMEKGNRLYFEIVSDKRSASLYLDLSGFHKLKVLKN